MTEQEAIQQLEFDRAMILFDPSTGETIEPEMLKLFNEDNYKTYIADGLAIKALEEIQQYREIGTVERYRVMAYKMKPEKPIKATNKYSNVYACPCCGYILIHKDETGWFCGRKYKFCPECAKNIDWSEKE